METFFTNTVVSLYTFSGAVSVLAYAPIMYDVLIRKNFVNTSSFLLWASTAAVAGIYATEIVQDALFATIAWSQFAACMFIVFVNIINKSRVRIAL